MREWQVGDPVGDGNDIGVPDTRYMGYLKEDEDDEDSDVNYFRFCFTQFHGGFLAQNYDMSFGYLKQAFEMYEELSLEERRQLSDNPFSHGFVIELCSKIYNKRDERQSDALRIIKRHKIPFIICDSCKNLYPNYYKQCTNCGKSFEKSENEEMADKIREVLEPIVYDKAAINELAQRSIILMESNDSRLVGIEEIDFMNVDFIFEKEHEYFKTTYRCLFCQENHDFRIFEDFESIHDHTKLLNNETFQKSIKDTEYRTGFKFKECDGGYGERLDDNRFDFVFTDDIYVFARFNMPNGNIAVFDIDLDSLKLSRDYSEYERVIR